MTEGLYKNLKIGTKFYYRIIISKGEKNKFGKWAYNCKCVCGKISTVEGRSLVLGLSKSCGCIRKKQDTQAIKDRKKKYKQDWFQKNKQRIYQRIKDKTSANPGEYQKQTKKYFLKWKYNIDEDEFYGWNLVAKGRCMICDRLFDESRNSSKMCIDHNHTTGSVRGLLCKSCNTGIGMFSDSPILLINALKYLGYNIT